MRLEGLHRRVLVPGWQSKQLGSPFFLKYPIPLIKAGSEQFRFKSTWQLFLQNPDDILDAKRAALDGYAKYFPTLQAAWQNQASLFAAIFENHDVTKHRNRRELLAKVDPILQLASSTVWVSQTPRSPKASTGRFTRCLKIPKHPKLPISQGPIQKMDGRGWKTRKKSSTPWLQQAFVLRWKMLAGLSS